MFLPSRASAAPDPETFVVGAEEALSEQRYAEAAALFERAYQTLSARERTSALGEHLVLSAAEAYEQAWLASDALEQLVAASRLLRKHLAAAEVREQPVGPEVLQTKQRIDALLDRLRGEPSPSAPEPVAASQPRGAGPPPDDPPPPPTNSADVRKPPDGLAVGLLVGGSVALLGGATMLGTGAAIPGWARDKLEERGGMGEQDQAFRDDANRLSIGLMAGGGALAGLGVVAIVVGAVRAARTNKARGAGLGQSQDGSGAVVQYRSSSSFRIRPDLMPGFRGFVISARW
jgi:hypothetical protein